METEVQKLGKVSINEIKLLKDYIVVVKEKAKESKVVLLTASNKNADGTVKWGEVVVVGNEVKNIKVGDRVVLSGMGADFVVDSDPNEYLLLKEDKLNIYVSNT